jgi:hypothetical protein
MQFCIFTWLHLILLYDASSLSILRSHMIVPLNKNHNLLTDLNLRGIRWPKIPCFIVKTLPAFLAWIPLLMLRSALSPESISLSPFLLRSMAPRTSLVLSSSVDPILPRPLLGLRYLFPLLIGGVTSSSAPPPCQLYWHYHCRVDLSLLSWLFRIV